MDQYSLFDAMTAVRDHLEAEIMMQRVDVSTIWSLPSRRNGVLAISRRPALNDWERERAWIEAGIALALEPNN